MRKGKRSWERVSKDVVLGALLEGHPEPREMLIEAERLKDPEDFSFIYEGTVSNLRRMGLIRELAKARPKTMFRRFSLTASGLKEAEKRRAHQRSDR
jgi:hypothetical protein